MVFFSNRGCGRRLYIVTLFFIFSTLIVSASQTKKDLEKKKEQIQKDIEYTNQLLSQTRKSKTNSLGQLITLNKKITYRTELISTINTELTGVDRQISYANNQMDSLQQRMTTLKKHYADLLYFAYKSQSGFS